MNNKSDFYKRLTSLVAPIAFQQLMLSLVSASDAFMLGLLSQDALSAVSLAGQVSFVQTLFTDALTLGLSILAAQYWGKKDVGAVERVFGFVFKLAFILSAVFSAAAAALPCQLMRIFTSEQALIESGAVYLRTVSPSFLLTGVLQVYLCLFKNTDRAKLSSLISSAGVVVNIALNALLIFGMLGLPRMGIAGAAAATVASRLIGVVWCLAESRKKGARLRLENIIHDDRLLRRDFVKYTAPVLGNEMVWGVGFTMYSVIMGHIGSDAVAANSVASVIRTLLACLCRGVGSGGAILVGNELGAGNLERGKEYGGRLCRLAIAVGTVTGLAVAAVIPFSGMFGSLSPAAEGYLKIMLLISAFNVVGQSVNGATIAGIFCSGGDSKFGFACDTVTMWCVTVPLGLLAAFVLKLPVPLVYLIINLDELIKLPAVYIHYKKYRWVRDLTEKETTI